VGRTTTPNVAARAAAGAGANADPDARSSAAARVGSDAGTSAATISVATTAAATSAVGANTARWRDKYLPYLFLAYLMLYPLPWLAHPPSTGDVVAFTVGVAAFLPLYFTGFHAGGRRLLACVAGILAIGFALQPAGGVWGVFAVYAAALGAYVRPTRYALLTFAAIGVAVLAFAGLRGLPPTDWAFTLFFGALVGFSSLASARIEAQNRELATSREEVRRLATAAERERIARDLHDVLGHTLTVVAVKADLAGKLLDRDVAAARREVDDIRDTARSALADLRAAVTGMRSTTLAAELAGARAALSSAGLQHDVRVSAGALPPPVENALAYVLREAVTNVVRHADASRVTIDLARDGAEARLEVRDDGRGSPSAEGNGIAGMRLRLAPLGGRLEIDGRAGVRVVARVPVGGAAA
jgi:two-component system sensor histidine kinase DesK